MVILPEGQINDNDGYHRSNDRGRVYRQMVDHLAHVTLSRDLKLIADRLQRAVMSLGQRGVVINIGLELTAHGVNSACLCAKNLILSPSGERCGSRSLTIDRFRHLGR